MRTAATPVATVFVAELDERIGGAKPARFHPIRSLWAIRSGSDRTR